MTTSNRYGKKVPFRCNYCSRPGHKESECLPKRRGLPGEFEDIKCHYCHKLGHMKKDCFALKRKSSERGESNMTIYESNMTYEDKEVETY